jgi:hypothetical protein
MPKLKCCLDLDGVLADIHRGIAEAFGVPNEWKVKGEWRFSVGLEIPEPWWKPCNYAFWANAHKTPWADDIVKMILAYFDPKEICICTSLPTSKGDFPMDRVGESVAGKIDWLQKHYPLLAPQFLIGPAKHFCAGPNKILVDDSDDNVKEFISEGGAAITFPRLWNLLHSHADAPVTYLSFQLASISAQFKKLGRD